MFVAQWSPADGSKHSWSICLLCILENPHEAGNLLVSSLQVSSPWDRWQGKIKLSLEAPVPSNKGRIVTNNGQTSGLVLSQHPSSCFVAIKALLERCLMGLPSSSVLVILVILITMKEQRASFPQRFITHPPPHPKSRNRALVGSALVLPHYSH